MPMKASLAQNLFKFCPICGDGNFKFNKLGYFKCETCFFEYYLNSASAVAVIIEYPNNKILLTKRAINPGKGELELPGGFVNPNERVEYAVKREIKEELNLEIIESRFLCSYPNNYLFSGLNIYTTDLAFICNVSNPNAVKVADDVCDYIISSKEEIIYNKIFSESIKNIIKYYFNQI
jgi:hypothetical protein